jgi:mono/diheme cytochrome c family protein
MKRAKRYVLLAATVLAVGFAGYYYWRTKNIGAVQRGFRVAEQKGCFTCHGPGGLRGMPNPGYGLDEIPPFTGGLISMYAQSEAEIREWILDGAPRRVRDDPEQWKHRKNAIILMPAWRGVLSDRELSDLVAYVKAVSDFENPPEGPADDGRRVAMKLGCFNCHGPQGRGTLPNVHAFKGYIPAWDGGDFEELAKDDGEIREWILDGGPKRLMGNPIARWFLTRQPIKMPAYRGHVTDDEVTALTAYIRWLRQHPY